MIIALICQVYALVWFEICQIWQHVYEFFLLVDACFWVSEFCLVLVKGLGRHFESKLHEYIGYFKLIVLKLGIFYMILMICCFY
jgi:hypothetical protein